MFLFWSVATLCSWALVVVSTHPQQLTFGLSKGGPRRIHELPFIPNRLSPVSPGRLKRNTDHHLITECIEMVSEEGQFFHKTSQLDGAACGVYIFTDPDKRVEIYFNHLDVRCENGGLVSFVDGWELNGQFFPSPEDHPKTMDTRFSEFCGEKKFKKVFVSSQNAALIQYRMPEKTSSFSFTVKFIKNPTPCNVLIQDTEDVFTLRNYGKRSNCSISALFPAAIRVLSLNVGIVASSGRGIELETGTMHKCQKRGLNDYAQIGGSTGLDNSGMLVSDSFCGMDSKPGNNWELIGCGTSTIRLVSSGAFDNSITVVVRQLTEDDISGYITLICPPEGFLE